MDGAEAGRELVPLGVGDDSLHLAELELAGDVPVWSQQHRDRAESVQRDREGNRARTGPHQHAHVLALAHADRDQAANDVVDSLVDLPGGVRAPFPEEEDAAGSLAGRLLDQQADRDAGARLDLLETSESWQLPRCLSRQLTHAAQGPRGRADERARDPGADAADELEAVADPTADGLAELERAVVRHALDLLWQLPFARAPVRPGGHGRPRRSGRGRADDEPEVARRQGDLVDIRAWGGLADRAHPGGGGNLVDGAHERQDRGLDVRQRHEPVLDHEPALEHAIVGDELAHEVRQRGTGPRHEAFAAEEAPLALAGQQRFAIVELADEVDPRAQRLDRIEQSEAGAAGPSRQCHSAEAFGEDPGRALDNRRGDAERHAGASVDGAAEGDQRTQALVASVSRGLVDEHPSLRVTREMDVAAGGRADAVDRVGDREHVVGQIAFEPAGLVLGGAEVDDPRVDAALVQDRDAAGRR